MIRAFIRMIFRGVMTLLLLAMVLGAYYLYRNGKLPFVQKAIEEATLTGSVKAAFAIHKDLAHRRISVEADGGHIRLEGIVASASERADAEALAASVEGVQRVENRLEIDPEVLSEARDERSLGEKIDDVALLAKVRAALRLDRETRGLDLDVTVTHGVVRLRGQVASEELKNRVRDRVLTVEGVTKLEDELELRSE